MLERLRHGPKERERVTSSDPSHFENLYRQRVLEVGTALLKEAGVDKIFFELETIISPDFPDVQIEGNKLTGSGIVQSQLKWNRRVETVSELNPSSPLKLPIVSVIVVEAFPLSGDLCVWSSEERELIAREKWSRDPGILEDAVARAYRNPVRLVDEPSLALGNK